MRILDIVYVLKMEYVLRNNIFGLKMMVKSGVEIVIHLCTNPFWPFYYNKFSNKKDFQWNVLRGIYVS